MEDIVFTRPLAEGLIVMRRSQFTMTVFVDGEELNCHCPTTGRIGNIDVSGRPCLLSKSDDPDRKTPYTVEAVSLNRSDDACKEWIGINQNAVNRYVEHYLRNGAMPEISDGTEKVERERMLGSSKLDFLVGDTYIEVKMPLLSIQMDIPEHVVTKKTAPFTSVDRFIRHMNELGSSLEGHQRAILLNCFIYDNPGFRVAERSSRSEEVMSSVRKNTDTGVEMWQVNFEMTETGVGLSRYFRIGFDEILSDFP